MVEKMKKCSKFYAERKSPSDFYGRNSWCKDCFRKLVRDNYLNRVYGISHDDYKKMLLSQGGGCAICGRTEDNRPKDSNNAKFLAVDHEHGTGRIRGILCENCNRALGLFKEDRELMKQAIKYLDQF